MSSEWVQCRLGDVAKEVTVGFVGTMANEYVETGIPFLRSLNVDRFRINDSDIKYVTEEFHRKISKSRLTTGDVVIVRTGKPGTCAVIPEELVESNCSDLVIVRCGSEINNRFLCYYVNSAASSHISAHLVGAVQQHFNVASAKAMEIPLPSLSEQKAIAHILGTLDDKIELNRKTNETLEAMAKALFKSWFVDFDPVRAKAEGRPTGLPAEISDLFPDSFEDSELGEIPSGWEVEFLGDHTDLIKGRSYKSDELNPSTTALVTLKSFQRNGGYRRNGLKQFTGEYKEQQVVRPGELVVALTDVTQAADVIGRPAIVKSDSFCSKLVASLDVGIIRPRGDGRLATPYLYSLMLTPGYVQHVLGYTSGTTVLHLAKDATAKFPLPIPGVAIANHYCRLADSILQQIDASDRQSELLAKTRDTLLPKLISGEIRIPDAEKMLEEVGV